MQKNTSCEQCYFVNPADSEYSCKFGIIEAIKDSKKITTINGYNKIHNYVCRYGISKTVVETKLKDFDVDIEEYTKSRVVPKYLLYITISESDDFNLLCDYVNQLSIQPKALSIVFQSNYDVQSVQKICENQFGKKFNWKLHMPIVNQSKYETAYSILSTDTRLGNLVDYILFANLNTIKNIVANNSMNKLNYTINIEQPDLGVFVCSASNDHFDGLLMTATNYKNFSIRNRDIVSEVMEKFKDTINYYD
jgi:hypothetical protein